MRAPPLPHRFALVAGALLGAAVIGATPRAHAQAGAGDVHTAQAEFDEGARLYRAGKKALAAPHFEAAHAAVPSARALRMALRARHEADQPARAATLGALALRRYPDDAKTAALAKEVVAAHESGLHRLDLTCATPCRLAVGTRAIVGAAGREHVLYVAPGRVTVSAAFDDGGGARQSVDARAGGRNALSFVSDKTAKVEPPKPPEPPKPAVEPPPPVKVEPVVPVPVAPEPKPVLLPPPGADEGALGTSSWVMIAGGTLTAVAAGVTIWSGVDTVSSPGVDAVREGCAGQGTDCPLYQEGLDKELRTNVLIGVTAGVGLATLLTAVAIGEWSAEGDTTAARWRPALEVGPGAASLGARGVF